MTDIFRKVLFGSLAISVLVLIGGCVSDSAVMTKSFRLILPDPIRMQMPYPVIKALVIKSQTCKSGKD